MKSNRTKVIKSLEDMVWLENHNTNCMASKLKKVQKKSFTHDLILIALFGVALSTTKNRLSARIKTLEDKLVDEERKGE